MNALARRKEYPLRDSNSTATNGAAARVTNKSPFIAIGSFSTRLLPLVLLCLDENTRTIAVGCPVCRNTAPRLLKRRRVSTGEAFVA